MPSLKAFLNSLAAMGFMLCGSLAAYAGAWDSAHLFDSPEKTVERVVVTGNFVKPRILAEIVRKETKTPYLLLPMPGDSRIFFCPAGKGPALEIREADLKRFFDFVKPKLVIVLGDPRFTPEYYIGLLGASGVEKVVIDSDNWMTNAITLGNLLECKDLPDRFKAAMKRPSAAKWSMDGEDVPKPEPVIQLREASNPARGLPAAKPEASKAPALSPQETMILMPAAPGTDEPALLVPASPKTARNAK